MRLEHVPQNFIKELKEYYPEGFIKCCERNEFYFDGIFNHALETYLRDDFEEYNSKRSIYHYYQKTKKRLANEVFSVLDATSKKNIMGEELLLCKMSSSLIDNKSLEDKIRAEVSEWMKDKDSFIYEFRYFDNLSSKRKTKALQFDALTCILNYMNEYYSGKKEFIYTKYTTAIIDSPFFGDPKSSNEEMVISRVKSSVRHKEIRLFTEFDAKVFSTINNYCYDQLMKSNIITVELSDLTHVIYGNRASKNKKSVYNSIKRLSEYGIKSEFENEFVKIHDEIYFIERITEVENKQTNKKSFRVVYTNTVRNALVASTALEHIGNTASLLSEKYANLLNMYILKIRKEKMSADDFIHEVDTNKLKKHININDNKADKKILSALEEIKSLKSNLESFEYIPPIFRLKIKGLSKEERLYLDSLMNIFSQNQEGM